MAAPIWQNGNANSTPIGVVYFVPDENFLNDIMSTIHISDNGGAYMIGSDGTTIADLDASKVCVENIIQRSSSETDLQGLADIHRDMIAGNSNVATYSTEGEEKIVGYAPVDGTDGWSLAVYALFPTLCSQLLHPL